MHSYLKLRAHGDVFRYTFNASEAFQCLTDTRTACTRRIGRGRGGAHLRLAELLPGYGLARPAVLLTTGHFFDCASVLRG